MLDSVIDIGSKFKHLRKERLQTLHQVSKGADIDTPLLSKIERGERLPTDEQLRRLAAHFEIHLDELKIQLVAQRILREYGSNASTYKAIKLVEAFLSVLIPKS